MLIDLFSFSYIVYVAINNTTTYTMFCEQLDTVTFRRLEIGQNLAITFLIHVQLIGLVVHTHQTILYNTNVPM